MVDLKLIRELVALMKERDLATIEFRNGEDHVSLTRRPKSPGPVAPTPEAPPAVGEADLTSITDEPAQKPIDPDAGLIPIVSPMVGTLHAAPDGESEPHVTVGSAVSADTVVCIIEAMKTPHPVSAGVPGTIERVLVADGSPVDYGRRLFLVRPSDRTT